MPVRWPMVLPVALPERRPVFFYSLKLLNSGAHLLILAEMTSPEIDALPRDIVVLMPVASCEQHSLHLPVFTDSMIGEEVARRVHGLGLRRCSFCRFSGWAIPSTTSATRAR